MEIFTKYFVNIRMNNKVKAPKERGPKGPPINRDIKIGPKAPLLALCNSEKEGSHRQPKPSRLLNYSVGCSFL